MMLKPSLFDGVMVAVKWISQFPLASAIVVDTPLVIWPSALPYKETVPVGFRAVFDIGTDVSMMPVIVTVLP
jgi:hypothetical protein